MAVFSQPFKSMVTRNEEVLLKKAFQEVGFSMTSLGNGLKFHGELNSNRFCVGRTVLLL